MYWDAGCFIALLNWEATTSPQILDALKAIYEDMLLGHLRIVTSDIFRTEVFGIDKSPRSQQIYNDLLACKNFEIAPIRSDIYQMAGEMRQSCKDIGQSLHTADALHIVMGNNARCDEIWTTDLKLVNKGKAGLIGNVSICLPYLTQPRLQLEL